MLKHGSLALLALALLAACADGARYAVIAKRVNQQRPLFSNKDQRCAHSNTALAQVGHSAFDYNYNAAFVPKGAGNEEGLIIRCQNKSKPGLESKDDPRVGPSYLVYR